MKSISYSYCLNLNENEISKEIVENLLSEIDGIHSLRVSNDNTIKKEIKIIGALSKKKEKNKT